MLAPRSLEAGKPRGGTSRPYSSNNSSSSRLHARPSASRHLRICSVPAVPNRPVADTEVLLQLAAVAPAATTKPLHPKAAAADPAATALPRIGSSHRPSSVASSAAAGTDTAVLAARPAAAEVVSGSETRAPLRVVVVGGSVAGLAAAVGLAHAAGAQVDVFDDGSDAPELTEGHKAAAGGLLVGLGPRGLAALGRLGLSLRPPPDSSSGSSPEPASDGPGSSGPAGVRLLQGLLVVGADGRKKEERYGSGGLAVIDSHTLTRLLLAEASALSAAAAARPAASHATSSTPLAAAGSSGGPVAAASAEAAQEAAMPPVPASHSGGRDAASPSGSSSGGSVAVHHGSQLVLLDASNKMATFMTPGGAARVQEYDLLIGAGQCGQCNGAALIASAMDELTQRQAAHKHPSRSSSSSSSSSSAGSAGTGATGSAVGCNVGVEPIELEFKCWRNLPMQPELKFLLPESRHQQGDKQQPASAAASSSGLSDWLLVWSGTTAGAAAGGSSVWGVPGGPSCSLMAWSDKSGASWSGAVFAAPQVFESLRSQHDYEDLLRSLMPAPAVTVPKTAAAARQGGSIGLPALWVKAIAAQLKGSSTHSVGRIPAPVAPVPRSLAAPTASLLLLSAAARPALSLSPQLLSPGVALALEDAAELVAAVAAANQDDDSPGGKAAAAAPGAGGGGEGRAARLEAGLRAFDRSRQPQAAALQQLEAQLSWLRHPFSPAASAAAAAAPPLSLPWLFGLVGLARAGLVMQWSCLLKVLPLAAATLRMLAKPHAAASTAAIAPTAEAAGAAGADISGKKAQAQVLRSLADRQQPSGASLLAFCHSTAVSPAGLRRLLHLAPLLLSVLWGGVAWAAVKAVQWAMLAVRAWSYAHGP